VIVMVTIGVIWLVVLINLRGVREAGFFQSITTFAKLIPFFAIATLGLLWVRPQNFAVFNPSGKPLFEASAAVAPLIMFAYLGLESATVPAGDVRDAQRTIPRATLLGISAAALLYVLGTVTVMGVIPREQLARSSSPFADAASAMWGHWAGGLIAVGALISSLGALNGWTLLMGQVPMAAAQDGLLPVWLGKRSERGVPAIAILISASLATALLLVEASGGRGFVAFYNFIVNLATMAAVIPYVFCSLAGVIIRRKNIVPTGGTRSSFNSWRLSPLPSLSGRFMAVALRPYCMGFCSWSWVSRSTYGCEVERPNWEHRSFDRPCATELTSLKLYPQAYLRRTHANEKQRPLGIPTIRPAWVPAPCITLPWRSITAYT